MFQSYLLSVRSLAFSCVIRFFLRILFGWLYAILCYSSVSQLSWHRPGQWQRGLKELERPDPYEVFPDGSDGKESACNVGDSGSISGSGRSRRRGNGYPLQCSCLENSMDRGAWQATVHGVTKSQTQLMDFHFSYLRARVKRLAQCQGLSRKPRFKNTCKFSTISLFAWRGAPISGVSPLTKSLADVLVKEAERK